MRHLALLAALLPTAAYADPPEVEQYAADPIDKKLGPCDAIAALPGGPTGKTTCKQVSNVVVAARDSITLVELHSNEEIWTRYALVIDRSNGRFISHALDFAASSAPLATDEPKRLLPQLRRARIDTSDAVVLDLTILWSHTDNRTRGPAAMWAQHAFLAYTTDRTGKPVILSIVMGQFGAPCRASIDYGGNIAYACEDTLRLTLHR
jgi:hypothetical protein